MSAFERILSGIPDMDTALDNIRLGDNVVFRVTDLEEFKVFVKPYVKQAIADKRNLIYIRFASHEPLVEEQDGVKVVHIELSHRFENFTVEIHNIIEREGLDAFYVFDCLSELQTAWATDLMMGNFFMVTCPFLFGLDTVAYFPIIRGRHSFRAIADIKETAQVFLDVYSDERAFFIRPLKVWNRYSETMFMPHYFDAESNKMEPLNDGIKVSRFYELMNTAQNKSDNQTTDSWDRFFSLAEQKHRSGLDTTEECSRMCNIMMSRDEEMRKLIKANFTPEDYFNIRKKMVGTGMIGGKACGMLLARKLIENHAPDIYKRLEPHDSFYIGSDVFYSYIVKNHFWDIRVRQRRPEEYFSLAKGFAECLRHGEFSSTQKEEFMRLLDYYGQNPIIVRSSSILEDGFGNAFAGKYESVFCANVGSPEKRLAEFENAVKIVYASTMSKGALDYRMRRNLQGRDEQMSLLVQRVSGSRYNEIFMPCAAGVGYSYSPYRFSKDTDPEQGMLRLVMGLGTGAVDRVEGSYPRLVHMDKPEIIFDEKNSVRQRKIDVIDLIEGKVVGKELSKIEALLPYYIKAKTLEHDYELERQFRERGKNRKFMSITCGGIVRNKELMDDMKTLMQVIAEHYAHPVDIEYTINLSEDGEYVINLLQCRPLQVAKDSMGVEMPENVDTKNVFLECVNASMGLSKAEKLDYIVYVDPIAYYNMKYNDKNKVSRALGEINWHFRGVDKNLLLLVPGRICTSSPELGVAATFSEISSFDTICEISESRAGYMPELSYGSHIFQDMVEAEILYAAIFENECTKAFRPEILNDLNNIVNECCTGFEDMGSIMGVYDVSGKNCRLYHDMKTEHLLCVFAEK